MKRVAVLGGGPAGAFAAERLAAAGLETWVFDEKLAWEKPCGGGVTYKAYAEYPFLMNNDVSKRVVTETTLSHTQTGAIKMALGRPLLIYSRIDLNGMMLERAAKAGAHIEKARVLAIDRAGAGWAVRTRSGLLEADYCIIATGARNPLRDVGTQLTAADTMQALGYFVPTSQEHIDIQFFPYFEGYIWVFPRAGHLSVGICGKGMPAQSLRQRLERYMAERGIPRDNASFYGHVLPSLERPAWRNNRVSGDGWLAVGDAAGLVDPVTGEGLYYAMRSADLASRVVLDETRSAAEKSQSYRSLLRRDFAFDLEYGSGLAKKLFLQGFLFSSVPARMIEFMRRSPRFCAIMQDLFAGTQPYAGLKGRLLKNLNGTLYELTMSFFLGQLLSPESAHESGTL